MNVENLTKEIRSLRNSLIKSYFQRLLLNDSDLDSTKNTGEGKIIFDVGVHSGESAFLIHSFPQAKIYSFEPIPEMVSKIRELNISNL